MLKIKTNKGYLDLGGDFTVQIDEKSPVMNDRGSQTVPVTVPCTGNNAKITGFAHRLDMGIKTMNEDQACTVLDGAYKRTRLESSLSVLKGFSVMVYPNSENKKQEVLNYLKGLGFTIENER